SRHVRQHAIDPDRIGDVLDLAIAERLVSAHQLMFDLLIDAAGDVHLARLGKPFKTGGNVDALAVDVISFDDHVAKIDADPVLHPVVLRKGSIAADQILLDHDAAPHGLDGTVEDRDEAVSGGLDQLAVVLGNSRFNEFALGPLDADMRALFVELHEAAIAGDVAHNDGGKAPRRDFVGRLAWLARFEFANFGHGWGSTMRKTAVSRRNRRLSPPRAPQNYHTSRTAQSQPEIARGTRREMDNGTNRPTASHAAIDRVDTPARPTQPLA